MTDPTPARDEAVTTAMVNAAFNEAKTRRMTGLPNDFRAILEAALASAPAPASGGVDAVAVSRMDVVIALREWFGGERYARDYEYLDMQMGPQMKATLEAVFKDRLDRAVLSQSTSAGRVGE